jgi:hypothetical protein
MIRLVTEVADRTTGAKAGRLKNAVSPVLSLYDQLGAGLELIGGNSLKDHLQTLSVIGKSKSQRL